jgi:hypothetical protein
MNNNLHFSYLQSNTNSSTLIKNKQNNIKRNLKIEERIK